MTRPNIKDEYNLISKRFATFVSSREDILSENQFVKLKVIETELRKASAGLNTFHEDIIKYQMNYPQIQSVITQNINNLACIISEVIELQERSTDILEKHLTKTFNGESGTT